MTPPSWLRRDGVVAGAMIALLIVVVGITVRELLASAPDRLPGTDAGIHYTWEVYTRSALSSGRLPYWNPYQYAGMPHLADSQMMVLYPPALLLRWLPPAAFLSWMAALHLVIGGAGALFLGRVLGLRWLAAAVAAVAVSVGGSAGPWLHNGHLLILNCVAWLPWALGASILTVRRQDLLPHPMLPIVMGLQLLAGYPQGTLYISAVVTLYFLYSAVWPDREPGSAARWRPLGQLAVAGALSLGLAAIQILPLATLGAVATRTAGLSYEDAVRGGWTAGDLTTFFRPNPVASDRAAYVGWLLACAVPLAVLDRRRRRIVVFLAGIAVAAVALAFGDNLPFYRLDLTLFPGFRIPGRALFVATLSFAMLGSIGLASLVARLTNRRRVQTVALTAALLLVAADLTTFASAAVETVPADSGSELRRWLGPPDGGRAISLCERRIARGAFSLAERASISGPLGMNLRDYVQWLNMVDSGDRPSDALGTVTIRRDLLDVSNVTTVVACEPLDAPSLTLVSEVDAIRVYRNDAAWPRAVWTCAAPTMSRDDVLTRLRRGRYRGITLDDAPVVSVRWASSAPDALRARLEMAYSLGEGVHRDGSTWRYVLRDASPANVRALVGDPHVEDTHGVDRQTGTVAPPDEERTDASATGMETVIGTSPCADQGRADVRLSDQPDGRVVVNVEAPVDGYVFLSEPFYPERAGFVDGRRVDLLRANIAFVAVPVPAGQHQVELRLVPSRFQAGLAVTTLTAGMWAVLVVTGRRRSRAR